MAFDPDAYLKSKEQAFDPDAYLANNDPNAIVQPMVDEMPPMQEFGQVAEDPGGIPQSMGMPDYEAPGPPSGQYMRAKEPGDELSSFQKFAQTIREIDEGGYSPGQKRRAKLKAIYQPYVRGAIKGAKGMLLGTPDIGWAVIKKVVPENDSVYQTMNLDEAMDYAMNYDPSKFSSAISELAEFSGGVSTAGKAIPGGKDAAGKLIRTAARFGAAKAGREGSKAIAGAIDPDADYGYEGAKGVAVDTVTGAIFSGAGSAVRKVLDTPQGQQIVKAVVRKIPRITDKIMKNPDVKIEQQIYETLAKEGITPTGKGKVAVRHIARWMEKNPKPDVITRGVKPALPRPVPIYSDTPSVPDRTALPSAQKSLTGDVKGPRTSVKPGTDIDPRTKIVRTKDGIMFPDGRKIVTPITERVKADMKTSNASKLTERFADEAARGVKGARTSLNRVLKSRPDMVELAEAVEYDALVELANGGDAKAVNRLNKLTQGLDKPTYDQLIEKVIQGDTAAADAIQAGDYNRAPEKAAKKPTSPPVVKTSPPVVKATKPKPPSLVITKPAQPPFEPPKNIKSLSDQKLSDAIDKVTKNVTTKKGRKQNQRLLKKLNREYSEREKETLSGVTRHQRHANRRSVEDEIKQTAQYEMNEGAEDVQTREVDVGLYYLDPQYKGDVYDIIGTPKGKNKAFWTKTQKMFTFDKADGGRSWDDAIQEGLGRGKTGIDETAGEMDVNEFVSRVQQASEGNVLNKTLSDLEASESPDDLALIAKHEMWSDGTYTQKEIDDVVDGIHKSYETRTEQQYEQEIRPVPEKPISTKPEGKIEAVKAKEVKPWEKIVDIYDKHETLANEGSWDSSVRQRTRDTFIRPLAKRIAKGGWHKTDDLVTSNIKKLENPKASTSKYLRNLEDAGAIEHGWDVEGNVYWAKKGEPVPNHLISVKEDKTHNLDTTKKARKYIEGKQKPVTLIGGTSGKQREIFDKEKFKTDKAIEADAAKKDVAGQGKLFAPAPAPAPKTKKAAPKAKPKAVSTKVVSEKKVATTADKKRIVRLDKMADTLDKHVEDKRRPMTQNPTPKRNKEYRSRLHDADNLERTQQAMRAMAKALERGDLPTVLESIKTKQDISSLVRKGLSGSGGYYDVIPSSEYADKSSAGKALQKLMEVKETPELVAARVEREGKQAIERAIEEVRFTKIAGFFPTPKPVISEMMDIADVKPGMSVLEPSAGKGDIADAMKEAGVNPDVIEMSSQLSDILELKGHKVIGSDFLENTKKYDRIVMNPPFEKLQDIDHIQHAYKSLTPGGRVVSIMSESPFFRSGKKAEAFREWLDSVDGVSEKLEAKSFTGKDAFRQTGVSGRIVTIDKPTSKNLRSGKVIIPGKEDIKEAVKTIQQATGKLLQVSGIEPAKLVDMRLGKDITADVMKAIHGKDVASLEFDTKRLGGIDENLRQMAEKFSKLPQKTLDDIMLTRGTPVGEEAIRIQQEALGRLPDEFKDPAVRKTIDKIADFNYSRLQQLAGDDINKIADYFYGIYKKPNLVKSFLKYWKSTDRYMKEKAFPTYADAKAHGLDVRDPNPINNLKAEFLHIAHRQAMVDLRDSFIKTGKHIKEVDKAPVNWLPIGDRVFDGYKVDPDLANLINNLISTNKVSQYMIPNAIRKVNNLLRTVKFMGSAFHQLVIAKQSVADSGYLGFYKPTARKGVTAGFKADDPAFTTPEYKDYVKHGGGHHYSLESQAQRALSDAIAKFNKSGQLLTKIIGFPLKIPTGYVKWMFNSYIPKVKYSAFEFQRLEMEKKLGRSLKSSEKIEIIKEQQNLYGEMNERLFGRSGTMTSLLRFMFMAPGFAEGNVRTVLKAGMQKGAGKSRANIINSLLLSAGLATAGTLFMTGHAPKMPERKEDIRDLFKIDTGKKDAKGRPIMIDMLTYDKDYWEIYGNLFTGQKGKATKAMFHRLGGMTSTAWQVATDMNNIMLGKAVYDWRENRVTEVTDPFLQKVLKLSWHELNRVAPISASVYQTARRKGASRSLAAAQSLLGVRPTYNEADKREMEVMSKMWSLRDQREKLYYELSRSKDPRKLVEKYNNTLTDILEGAIVSRDIKTEQKNKLYLDLDKYLQNKVHTATQSADNKTVERAVKVLKNFNISPEKAEKILKDYYARPKTVRKYNPLESDRVIGRARKRKRLQERLK